MLGTRHRRVHISTVFQIGHSQSDSATPPVLSRYLFGKHFWQGPGDTVDLYFPTGHAVQAVHTPSKHSSPTSQNLHSCFVASEAAYTWCPVGQLSSTPSPVVELMVQFPLMVQGSDKLRKALNRHTLDSAQIAPSAHDWQERAPLTSTR